MRIQKEGFRFLLTTQITWSDTLCFSPLSQPYLPPVLCTKSAPYPILFPMVLLIPFLLPWPHHLAQTHLSFKDLLRVFFSLHESFLVSLCSSSYRTWSIPIIYQ